MNVNVKVNIGSNLPDGDIKKDQWQVESNGAYVPMHLVCVRQPDTMCTTHCSPYPHSTRPGLCRQTHRHAKRTFSSRVTTDQDKHITLTVMLAKVPPTNDAQTYLASVYPTMAESWQLPSAIRLSTQFCQDMFVKLVLRWKKIRRVKISHKRLLSDEETVRKLYLSVVYRASSKQNPPGSVTSRLSSGLGNEEKQSGRRLGVVFTKSLRVGCCSPCCLIA